MARVNNLGLNRIMDLRQESERQRDPDKTYAGNEAIYDLLPYAYGDPYLMTAEVPIELAWDVRLVDFSNWYINILEANKDGIEEAFERYADPSQYPILVHCTAGKDRAGVTAALLLLLLDVPETTIVEDYMLTSELVDIQKKMDDMEGYLELFASIVPAGVTVVDWMPMLGCVQHSMENLLDYIDMEYNGVEGFLESIGITSSQQQAIRDVLLKD
jgi:protein-tyrosine phosphatase